MKRAWYILALMAALAWGAQEAQALVIGVQATWTDSTIMAKLNDNSIVQVIVYKNDAADDPSDDPTASFQPYGNSYLPNTVPAGHVLAYTGHMTALPDATNPTSFVFKEYIDIDPYYDRIYIRVFELTEFPEGEAQSSGWGVSDPNPIKQEAGLGFTWFSNVDLTQTNAFEVIPEPGTACLLLCGLGGLACAGRRGKRGGNTVRKTGDGEQ